MTGGNNMTIEELQKLKRDLARPIISCMNVSISTDWCHTVYELIDAEIERQSVTDDDVTKAIKSFEEMIQYHGRHEDEYRQTYGGKVPAFVHETISETKLAIDALRQYRKQEPCKFCQPGAGLYARHRTDRNALTYRSIKPKHCPNCGRKLEVTT